MKKYEGYVLVYGGNGALGSGCVTQFKTANWWVACIALWKNIGSEQNAEHDKKECEASVHLVTNKDDTMNDINKEADINILVHFEKNLQDQEKEILANLGEALQNHKLDAVICVAGGFESGNTEEDLVAKADLMWKQNVWPSLITASIATKYLKPNGFVCLPGAKAAREGTPNMIGYGMAKAAVHQLALSLATSDSGLPLNALVVAILPVTLDTLMNRQMMPESDVSAWTPTKYITDLLFKWAKGKDRPKNGSLVQFVTKNFNTDITFL